MIDLKETRRQINDVRADYRSAKKQLKTELKELNQVAQTIEAARQAQEIIQAVGQEIQQRLHERIAGIVTQCLQVVFEYPYEFRIKFEKKRGKTEARFVFAKNGEEYEAKAKNSMEGELEGGVIDVAAFALRLACLVLSKPRPRKLLVADEPFRFVDGDNRLRVREMIELLADELGIQFILVTHDEALQIGTVVDLRE